MIAFDIDIGMILERNTNSIGAVAFSSAHFGAGVGPIYLDEVGCSGGESRLIDCPHNSNVTCSGGPLKDAGVRCQGKSMFYVVFIANKGKRGKCYHNFMHSFLIQATIRTLKVVFGGGLPFNGSQQRPTVFAKVATLHNHSIL